MFIGCTESEFQDSKRYLPTVRPSNFFVNSLVSSKPMNEFQRTIPKPGIYLKKVLF